MERYTDIRFPRPDQPAAERDFLPTHPDYHFLERLQHVLQENAFDSRYNVPRLCRDLGMSASRLHRNLVRLTGQSAVRMIQNLRLQKARYLLVHHQQLPIAAVAFACGFDDPDYFSRVFSHREGISPSRYRSAAPCCGTAAKPGRYRRRPLRLRFQGNVHGGGEVPPR